MQGFFWHGLLDFIEQFPFLKTDVGFQLVGNGVERGCQISLVRVLREKFDQALMVGKRFFYLRVFFFQQGKNMSFFLLKMVFQIMLEKEVCIAFYPFRGNPFFESLPYFPAKKQAVMVVTAQLL